MAELLVADPAADCDRWLELRRAGVTATDIATILGLVGWDSPWALWHRKRGLLPEVEASDRMRLGSWLEDRLIEQWNEIAERPLDPSGLWASGERAWQLATPDRVVMAYRPVDPVELKHLITGLGPKTERYPVAVLECKTSATRDGWGGPEAVKRMIQGIGTELDGTYEDVPGPGGHYGSQVPAHVRAQVLWQMDVLGVAAGHVAVVFLPSGEFRSYTIEHAAGCSINGPGACSILRHAFTESACCLACHDIRLMRAQGLEFYRRMRGELPPPPLDGSQATLDALKHLNTAVVKGKEAELGLALGDDYLWALECYADAKAHRDRMAAEVRAAMGDAQYAVKEGVRVARREMFKRAGYEVGPCEVDRLVRVKPKESE